MKVFVGIDVGDSGGIASIDPDGTVHGVWSMPVTDREIVNLLNSIKGGNRVQPVLVRAMLERVRSSPVMGVKSAFTFGGSYRALKMALTIAEIPFDEVTPKKWQRKLDCLSGGEKNITKARAQQLFPGITITHATADALLLAEYCRREFLGLGSLVAPGTDRTDDLGALS